MRVNVPLLADKDNLATLRALGAAKFFPTEEVVKCTTNATFLVDLDKRVRYTTRYPTTMGRNWYVMRIDMFMFRGLYLYTAVVMFHI